MKIHCLICRYWLIAALALTGLGIVQPVLLQADTVQGYLINPYTDQRLPQVDIAFLVRQDGQLSEMVRKPTDEQGQFSFSGPFLNANLEFFLVAFYKSVPYPTSALKIGGQRQVILEAYEPSDDASQIHVTTSQFFFLLSESNIEVAQSLYIENFGQKTYVGQGQDRRVAEISLPTAGIFGLKSHTGKLNTSPEGRFFDNQPLPPGSTHIALSYNLDPLQFNDGYPHSIIYPTASLEIFLQPATLALKPPFEDLGTVEIQQQSYRRYSLSRLTQGQNLTIPLPLNNSKRWLLKWLALGLGLALAVIVPVLAWGQPTGSKESNQIPDRHILEHQRQILLANLAHLDDSNTTQTHQQHYSDTRDQLVAQILVLYRLLEDNSET